ncbi:MAG TPA: cytochrome c oxidase subunit II [Actinomycetes bacterium]|jgi:cytochrome c oxidase subunit 2|nr:cytochrome c oxidase subunit II [Actinomycetes bacterium]
MGRRSGRRLGWGRLLTCACVGVLLAACSGPSPSALDPKGPGAARVAGLWWLLFWISAAVFTLVTLLVVTALFRRRGSRDQVVRQGGGERLVVLGGVLLPAVVLTGVYFVGLHDLRSLTVPARTDVTVQVTGHDWWWEVRYPDQGIVTANELHVPVGRPVRLVLTSRDVIHSFWVPQLTVKTDLIPGHTNTTWLQASQAGVYRGQCAEYCGLQHARMAILVVAEPPDAFASWLAAERGPAVAASDQLAARGRQALEQNSCAACHTVRGTSAGGTLGPDLTHFGSRRTIGAGTLSNTRGNLGGWIVNSQAVKPGNRMPAQPLTPEELQALLAYLETLK